MGTGHCLDTHTTDDIAQFYATIGKHIKVMRVIGDLNQRELAERAGIDQATMSRIEAGKQHISLHTLYTIADALAIPVSALLPTTTP